MPVGRPTAMLRRWPDGSDCFVAFHSNEWMRSADTTKMCGGQFWQEMHSNSMPNSAVLIAFPSNIIGRHEHRPNVEHGASISCKLDDELGVPIGSTFYCFWSRSRRTFSARTSEWMRLPHRRAVRPARQPGGLCVYIHEYIYTWYDDSGTHKHPPIHILSYFVWS